MLLDRHASAEAHVREEEEVKFKEVSEAYSILSDPQKKMRYDNGQDLEDMGMGGARKLNDNKYPTCLRLLVLFCLDFDPSDIFTSFFGPGMGGGGRGGFSSGGGFDGGSPFFSFGFAH